MRRALIPSRTLLPYLARALVVAGTTIAFRYRKKLYKFNVLECIDADGKAQEAVCVQVRSGTMQSKSNLPYPCAWVTVHIGSFTDLTSLGAAS